ncbi:MAG TPA: hypothetical protein VMV10_32985 [Pirellulales bacterium]|nr:hypothetical protein [Pirellulales bacterium]
MTTENVRPPRRRPKRLRAKPKPPLSMSEILAWADAFFDRHGRWPIAKDGRIREAADDTWQSVDQALRAGRRDLTPGSSLARLLNEHRGVRNRKALRPYAVDEILAWADAHRSRTGCWPQSDSGPVAGAPGENWRAVEAALRAGIRGLPGGSSIAKLLAERRGVRNSRVPPPYSVKQILAWAEAHCERTGLWPTHQSGPVADAPGETWLAVDRALRSGRRGLRGGTSLPKLLHRCRRVKIKHRRQPPLDVETILVWADAHRRRTGRWPNQTSGPIPQAPGKTWGKIDVALRKGKRGFGAGQTIGKLLAKHRGVRNLHSIKPLTVKLILAWADEHFSRHGRWPGCKSGPIDGEPGDNWCSVDNALRHGLRGLKGGSSIARLLARYRTAAPARAT